MEQLGDSRIGKLKIFSEKLMEWIGLIIKKMKMEYFIIKK
jgi:hypothetical protein